MSEKDLGILGYIENGIEWHAYQELTEEEKQNMLSIGRSISVWFTETQQTSDSLLAIAENIRKEEIEQMTPMSLYRLVLNTNPKVWSLKPAYWAAVSKQIEMLSFEEPDA